MSILHPTKFGWVGLGAMGYPMAAQLRRKIPKSSELCIFDVDHTVLERFVEEVSGQGVVTIGSNAREVADKSVGRIASIVNSVSQFESAGIRDYDSSRRQVTFGGICLSMKNLVQNRQPCKRRLLAA